MTLTDLTHGIVLLTAQEPFGTEFIQLRTDIRYELSLSAEYEAYADVTIVAAPASVALLGIAGLLRRRHLNDLQPLHTFTNPRQSIDI